MRRALFLLAFIWAPSICDAAEPRIVVFAQRRTPEGTTVVFDITTPAGREARTRELIRAGFEVHSGPAESDQTGTRTAPPMPVGPPIVATPTLNDCPNGICPGTKSFPSRGGILRRRG